MRGERREGEIFTIRFSIVMVMWNEEGESGENSMIRDIERLGKGGQKFTCECGRLCRPLDFPEF